MVELSFKQTTAEVVFSKARAINTHGNCTYLVEL
jgi:hypothetical protein